MSKFRLMKFGTRLLDLETTLLCGQTFTWKHFKTSHSSSFVGVLGNHVLELTTKPSAHLIFHSNNNNSDENNTKLKLEDMNINVNGASTCSSVGSSSSNDHSETDQHVYYRKLFPMNHSEPFNETQDETSLHAEIEQLMDEFFHFQTYDIDALHETFATCDPKLFGKIVKYYQGWRLLKLEPIETLFSFICSSNNNVARITKMVQSLCEDYGTYLGQFSIDEGKTTFPMYKFPTLNQLESCTEQALKDKNFGYRAKYIIQTIQKLKKKPENYLVSLQNKELYPTTHSVLDELKQFSGVGMKVASCIALYCCNRFDCVPTDVHILRIARNCYPSMKKCVQEKKTLSEKDVKLVMKEFVNIFGEYAGLAQMILYGSQLSAFKERIPQDVRTSLFSDGNKKRLKKTESSDEEEDEDEQDSENTSDQDSSKDSASSERVEKTELEEQEQAPKKRKVVQSRKATRK
ncbi:hypothetical protein C9374_002142 [Naegleria lovaniensis]|uniref:DNA-(apurinic or apyrimidinic site) lyase n=1 Tax=Naegleria lovaniensis TaxID=51637 RepID=A0AA88GU69_NAELO|nr:uncharacterized protein C9374_002142 [Naegleria lovaniensis]KAG2387107.1 hypothetical protein C9374_002142 [Naegleria lovaniensis]